MALWLCEQAQTGAPVVPDSAHGFDLLLMKVAGLNNREYGQRKAPFPSIETVAGLDSLMQL